MNGKKGLLYILASRGERTGPGKKEGRFLQKKKGTRGYYSWKKRPLFERLGKKENNRQRCQGREGGGGFDLGREKMEARPLQGRRKVECLIINKKTKQALTKRERRKISDTQTFP